MSVSSPNPKKNQELQVITFGCRLNTYESEVMRQHAQSQGLQNTIIVNTCAVTNEAERQGRQAIRRIKRENPEAFMIVTGCGAQMNPTSYAGMPEVDRVLGNQEKMLESSFAPDNPEAVQVTDIMMARETSHHLMSGFENRARAFIEIQNGCNHRCTFCTIPYGRGNNRSAPLARIVEQVRTLVDHGCKEVVFTGVDITDYGKDLPGQPSLGQMIRRVLAQVPELPRLRLSSIDPAELDQEVMHLIAEEPRLMPHFHISLQAGDDMILKRMKRRHLRHHIIDFCAQVRQLRPDVVFGADIIAGFPTETDAMFENTVELVQDCQLTYLHVFPYSKRTGTPAARMPQVEGAIIKERAMRLREVGQKALQAFLASQVGQARFVLTERHNKGHTEHFAPVWMEGGTKDNPAVEPGHIIRVRVTGVKEKKLIVTREEECAVGLAV